MMEHSACGAPLAPFSVEAAMVALEEASEQGFGTVAWRTLICGDRTPSAGMVLGVAEFGPEGTLLPHRHAHAEWYYGLEGAGVVTIEGIPHIIAPGVAVYIPGDAEHGTLAGPEGLKFVYGFASDRFADVQYRFSAHPLCHARAE